MSSRGSKRGLLTEREIPTDATPLGQLSESGCSRQTVSPGDSRSVSRLSFALEIALKALERNLRRFDEMQEAATVLGHDEFAARISKAGFDTASALKRIARTHEESGR